MNKRKVYLTLQNGDVFQGYRFGSVGNVTGELVFSTGMVGYVETITDPECLGRIVVQTFPLVGNYGAMRSDMESKKAWASAFIVREVCDKPSNFRMETTLDEFMKEEGVVGIYGVDTRQLTKILREQGAMNARISDKPLTEAEKAELSAYQVEAGVKTIASTEKKVHACDGEKYTVALWNFGAKRTTIEGLVKNGCKVIDMPTASTSEEILALGADGVVITGGAGNPQECTEFVAEIKKIIGKIPVFGIEFGNLLLGMAFDGKTEKLTHDHRGAQPVKCKKTGKVYISSQNHGYALLEEGLKNAEVIYSNVNDGSCEGVEYEGYNAFGVQFAPESCSLTGEENPVYAKFFALMKKEKENA